jgi:hypothetical protein
MRTKINGVPAAFFGFNGHEEEIDEIKKAIGSRIERGMESLVGWMEIADVFEESCIHNVVFTADQGICFVRACEKYVAKDKDDVSKH